MTAEVAGLERSLAERKQGLRDRMRAQRRALTAEWVEAHSARVAARLAGLPEFRAAQRVSLYLSLPGEVATGPLIEAAWAAGKRVSVPAVRPGGGYGLARLTAATRLAPGPLGVLEPAPAEWIETEEIDLMVTPGLAFDGEGRRLGHGGGHYDRMLIRLKAGGGMAAGIAFEFQVVPEIPVGPLDRPVDRVVTETHTYGCAERA